MIPRSRLRPIGLALTGCAVLAACGASSTPVPSVTAAGVEPAAGGSSPPPVERSTATGANGGGDGPITPSAPATDAAATPGDAATGDEASDPDPTPDQSEQPGAEPSPAEIARLVAEEVAAAGDGAQHVVADLDGDGTQEIVVAGVLEDRARVAAWWWDAGVGFGDPVVLDAGPGRAVVEVRVADVTQDDARELLVRIGGGARDSLALWSVRGPGDVRPLEAVGGCFAGSHVFGATSARLQSRGDDPPAILATCDDTPLPVADWSTAVYEFRDGAYRFVPSPIGGADGDPAGPGDPVEDAATGPALGGGGDDGVG